MRCSADELHPAPASTGSTSRCSASWAKEASPTISKVLGARRLRRPRGGHGRASRSLMAERRARRLPGPVRLSSTTSEAHDHIIVGWRDRRLRARRPAAARMRRRSVLLLEAGGRGQGFLDLHPRRLHQAPRQTPPSTGAFASEPEESTATRAIVVPRGKGLGSSTLINGMIYVRGQPQDFDGWAQRAAPAGALRRCCPTSEAGDLRRPRRGPEPARHLRAP